MRFIWIVVLACITLCNACSLDSHKQKEASIRQKEQQLKEREQHLREKCKGSCLPAHNSVPAADSTRAIRYLYFANGGLIAYFNDGTVTGCPHCDFCRSNIEAMYTDEPFTTYSIAPDGSLVVGGTERRLPDPEQDEGWALVDYKWYTTVPQQ